MRIVDRKTFLALPAGTLYLKGERWVFGQLCVKEHTCADGNDWCYLNPFWPLAYESGEAFSALERSLQTGASFEMEDVQIRDGTFQEDAIFMILESADLAVLHRLLSDARIAEFTGA